MTTELMLSMPEQLAELPAQADSGVVYRGTCVARSTMDPERAATANFAVIVQEVHADGRDALVSLAQALAAANPNRRIIIERFPAGEALVAEEPNDQGRQDK